MKWYIAILALVGLSIPLVRSLRSPSPLGSSPLSPSSAPPEPDAVPMWQGSTDSPTLTAAAQSIFGAGADVIQSFGDSIMQAAKNAWAPPAKAAPYLADIDAATAKYGLPPNLLARQIQKESSFNPNAVNRSSGAQGLGQFLPSTAADLGIDPFNPAQAIDGTARYMAQLYAKFGSWAQALAAYNWGQGNVARKGIAAAPAETQDYYKTILADIGLPIA